MHVQASTYSVLTHKSFPSFESGLPPLSFFMETNTSKCSVPTSWSYTYKWRIYFKTENQLLTLAGGPDVLYPNNN